MAYSLLKTVEIISEICYNQNMIKRAILLIGIILYIKHHLNHGEEIGVKKLKTVKNRFVYGFLRREIPVINGCLVLGNY